MILFDPQSKILSLTKKDEVRARGGESETYCNPPGLGRGQVLDHERELR